MGADELGEKLEAFSKENLLKDGTLLAHILKVLLENHRQEAFEAIVRLHDAGGKIYLGYRSITDLIKKATDKHAGYAVEPLRKLKTDFETKFEAEGFGPMLETIGDYEHPEGRIIDIFMLAAKSPNRAAHLKKMFDSDKLVAAIYQHPVTVLGTTLSGIQEVCGFDKDTVELLENRVRQAGAGITGDARGHTGEGNIRQVLRTDSGISRDRSRC